MTTCAGKLHHTGWDQMQGWRKRLGPTPVKRAVGADAVGTVEGVDLDYDKGMAGKWSDAKEIRRAGPGDSRVQVQDRRSVEGTEQYLSQFLSSPHYDREGRNDEGDRQPLVLKVSLLQPHYPYFTDEERFTYYLNRVEPHLERPGDHPWLDRRAVVPGEDVTERDVERATAAYYGMIDAVDDLFGRVLNALEHHGEDLDDWIVVYTSDHGEMLGERGLWEKKTFYEASVRVPLIIRAPGIDPGTVDANVNLCDLYATLCELAGVASPDDLDSRSLVDLMRGDAAAWHDRHRDETVSGVGEGSVMIKRGDLKYVSPVEGPEVLFDLDRDPDERTDRIDDPAYADATATFRSRRAELGYDPESLA
jgi:choline-sulfatase